MASTAEATVAAPPSPSELDCSFVDVQQLETVEHLLGLYLAKAILRKRAPHTAEGYAHVKEEFVQNLKRDLPKAVARGPDTIVETITKLLAAVSKQNSSVLGSMGAAFSKSETYERDAEALAAEVNHSGTWKKGERNNLSRAMIASIDVDGRISCKFRGTTHEQTLEHKCGCLFRPQPCTNEGCTRHFSAHAAAAHDAECPYKIVPCRLQCERPQRRMDMDEHCEGMCAMKVVTCPLQSIGCPIHVVQGTIGPHLINGVHEHLLLAVGVIQSQSALIDSLKESLSAAEARAALLQVEHVATATYLEQNVKNIADATRKIADESESKIRKANSALESLGGDVGSTQQKVAVLQTQLQAMRDFIARDAKAAA